ncbi:hypothetical protein CH063_10434, partial [Colletotrichum higginsianum]
MGDVSGREREGLGREKAADAMRRGILRARRQTASLLDAQPAGREVQPVSEDLDRVAPAAGAYDGELSL